MFEIGGAFILSILTFYSVYRSFVQKNPKYEELACIHLTAMIFFMTYTLMVIYIGSKIASKVNIQSRYGFKYQFD